MSQFETEDQDNESEATDQHLSSVHESNHASENEVSDSLQTHTEKVDVLASATPVPTSATNSVHLSESFDLSKSTLEMPETVDLSGKNAAATVTVSETSQEASLTHFSATNTLDISEALWQEFLSGQLTVVGNGNTIAVYQAGTGKALFHLEADHAIDYVGVAQQADGSVHLTL